MMGEKAEMDRLEVKAEEAMANGDPNGATLAIGRAALMASVLAKQQNNPQIKLVYEGAEALFRAQENAYRALAIFEQAGGQLPRKMAKGIEVNRSTWMVKFNKTFNVKSLKFNV